MIHTHLHYLTDHFPGEHDSVSCSLNFLPPKQKLVILVQVFCWLHALPVIQ